MVIVANSAELKIPKRTSFPSMLPLDGFTPSSSESRIARSFDMPENRAAGQEQDEHRRPHRPSMPLLFDHSAQVIGQAGGDREDRKDLNEIA